MTSFIHISRANQEDYLEELYLAGIQVLTNGEFPIGVVGKWAFERRNSYWSASVVKLTDGLPLNKAMILDAQKNPITGRRLGGVIRAGGHAGAMPPNEFGASIDWDAKETRETIKEFKKNNPDIEWYEALKDGAFEVPQYVNCYHIDTLLGLIEFVKFIKNE